MGWVVEAKSAEVCIGSLFDIVLETEALVDCLMFCVEVSCRLVVEE